MASTLFPYGEQPVQKELFKVSTAAVKFNSPVELLAGTAGRIRASDNWTNTIGFVMPDDAYEAENGTTMVAVGDYVNVAMRGPVINMTCGTTITRGNKIALNSAYKATGDSTATVGTSILGIALESGVLDGVIKVVRL